MIRYRARWIVPVTAPPIANGVVGVEGTQIVFVGEANDAPPGDDVDFGEAVMLPGLVNTHCHLELTAMRGFLEDLDFRRWILRLTNARRAVLDREALLDSARYGIEEGLLAGITTYADTGESGVAMQAMSEAKVRGINFQEVFGPDPAQCAESIATLKERVSGLRYLETPLLKVGVSPHAPYTVSDELFRATTDLGRDWHLPMAIHIAESELEQQLVVDAQGSFAEGLRRRGIAADRRGSSPIELLDRLGVLAAKPLLIHCVRATPDDIARIASSASSVAHCPASNAKLGHGVAPLDEMLAAGIKVGLGSDSMASNNRMDILEEARLALLAQRARLGSFNAPTAEDVLEMATVGGAAALGLQDQTGSIEVGKQADLSVFGLDPVGPTQDPITAAVFSITAARTRFVSVAGRPLVRDARLVSSRDGLADRLRALGEALWQWLESGGEMRGVV